MEFEPTVIIPYFLTELKPFINLFVIAAGLGFILYFTLHLTGLLDPAPPEEDKPEATEAGNTIQYEIAKLEEYNTNPRLRQIKKNDRKLKGEVL